MAGQNIPRVLDTYAPSRHENTKLNNVSEDFHH
jgi:hypothetical protein